MQQKRIGVLYITYDGLCDPLGQSQVIPYLKGLARKDVNIAVLSFEKKESLKKISLVNQIKKELDRCGISWKYLGYHNKPRILASLYDIISGLLHGLSLIKKYRLNIVHARGYIPAFFALYLKKFTQVKFIFDMRGFWIEEKVDAGFWSRESMAYKLLKLWEKIMLGCADYIIVLTEKAKLFLANQISQPLDIIEVIPTCVDLNIFKPLEGLKRDFLKDKIVLLYCGSIGTFYGFKDVVRFFKLFRDKEQRSFLLALVNNQPDIAEKALKMDSLPQEAYKILSLPYPEVPEWLREADLSLMFYHRDNSYAGCCPTKFAESLACGIPVIANKNIGDCDDIITKEKVGFILDGFSDSEYEKVIDRLLPALKERGILHHRCRGIAEKLFSLDMGVEKYAQVYDRLS